MKLTVWFVTLALAGIATGCSHSSEPQGNSPTAHAGAPELMTQYGCPTCHVIPHVPGAVGKVGPSLDNLAQRSYLAGTLQNSPGNLVHWIQHPQQVHPGTAMPEMGVTVQDANTIASFLESSE